MAKFTDPTNKTAVEPFSAALSPGQKTPDTVHPLSDRYVCLALVKSGLITKSQAKDIYDNRDRVKGQLEAKKRTGKTRAQVLTASPIP